jgi:hypothetical protein
MACAPSIACRRDSSSTYSLRDELRLDDVDLLDVFEARRPGPSPQALHAPDDLGQPLQHDENAGDRNDRLEVVDRRPVRGHRRMLADAPGEAA